MSFAKVCQKRASNRLKMAVFLAVLAFFLIWLSLISGSDGVVFGDTARLFKGEEQFGLIVQSIRLPRALAALLVGMLLALSGVVMQGVLRNPLASPFTLGVSHAAGFGASFAIIVLENYTFAHPLLSQFAIASSAFLASIVCTFLIIFVGKKAKMTHMSIILVGVALGSLFHSATMFLQYFTTEINAAATLFWTFGDLSRATMPILGAISVVFVVSFALLWLSHWKFDALGFGDESAFNKGVNVPLFRAFVIFLSALCTAVAVAFFGIIGFIGLVAPHLMRLLVGSSHVALIPLSVLCGGVLLLGADLVARLLLYPSVLPVGIITSFIGAPMLLYLLLSRTK